MPVHSWRPDASCCAGGDPRIAPFAAQIFSLAVVDNERSRAVMRRIGMQHDPEDDVDHPLADGRTCAATCSTACGRRIGARRNRGTSARRAGRRNPLGPNCV
jgi:hypothetical protein